MKEITCRFCKKRFRETEMPLLWTGEDGEEQVILFSFEGPTGDMEFGPVCEECLDAFKAQSPEEQAFLLAGKKRKEKMSYTTILCNSIAMGMFSPDRDHEVRMVPIDEYRAKQILHTGFQQAVGHPATAAILSQRLGLVVEANRMNVRLQPGDHLIIAQVVVPRLEEGQVLTHEQVEALPIQWWSVIER